MEGLDNKRLPRTLCRMASPRASGCPQRCAALTTPRSTSRAGTAARGAWRFEERSMSPEVCPTHHCPHYNHFVYFLFFHL